MLLCECSYLFTIPFDSSLYPVYEKFSFLRISLPNHSECIGSDPEVTILSSCILLATVVLSELVNGVFIANSSGSIPLIIVGIVVLIIGQLFTLVLAIFEPGIQGATE